MNDAGKAHAPALRPPVRTDYFADPFITRTPSGGYAAFGTNPHGGSEDAVFEVLLSDGLVDWVSDGYALERLPSEKGDEYWAPEVCWRDGKWWMYYSVGHDIHGHHIRVAQSDQVTGPFVDLGVNLTPTESFAIDPHPYQDDDGAWYLYFARDVFDADRVGTHLAVGHLDQPSSLTSTIAALEPNADWQIYQRARHIYGGVFDWHTLEGPSVVRRHGVLWMTFSGGAWTGPGYAVSWASATSPMGPWKHAHRGSEVILESDATLIGPGHNSLVVAPDGTDRIAFHSWNADRTARQMHIAPIDFGDGRVTVRTNPTS